MSRYGTSSRPGYCHIHGSYISSVCPGCNPATKEQADTIAAFAIYVVDLFEDSNIGEQSLTSIFDSCMGHYIAKDYLRLYSEGIERYLAQGRLAQVIKSNISVWIDGKRNGETL